MAKIKSSVGLLYGEEAGDALIQIKWVIALLRYMSQPREALMTDKMQNCECPDQRCSGITTTDHARRLAPEALQMHMAIVYAEKAELCDQLEQIADSLPRHVDRLQCLRVAGRLLPLLRQAHRFEEDLLFAYFLGETPHRVRPETTERLRSEHLHDEYSAEEITEELLRLGHGGAIGNAEALSFMLRAFFENVRRHMAFELEHLVAFVGSTGCSVGSASVARGA